LGMVGSKREGDEASRKTPERLGSEDGLDGAESSSPAQRTGVSESVMAPDEAPPPAPRPSPAQLAQPPPSEQPTFADAERPAADMDPARPTQASQASALPSVAKPRPKLALEPPATITSQAGALSTGRCLITSPLSPVSPKTVPQFRVPCSPASSSPHSPHHPQKRGS